MQRLTELSLTLGAALCISAPLAAQGHTTHRHPAGAKIIMPGVVVEPVCRFAQRLEGAALQDCVRHISDQDFHPALLASDSMLYLLHASSTTGPDTRARLRQLVGQSVKVDGTVFPAANAYLIVVDSIRTTIP